MEKNWVETIPGKGWFMILRLYGPLEPWFNKTWRPEKSKRSSSLVAWVCETRALFQKEQPAYSRRSRTTRKNA